MKILAFETATPRGGVALTINGRLFGERHVDGAAAHSRACLRFAGELVAEAGITLGDMDVFAASRGPGSFIGVRVGLTLAKGLAWSLARPVVGVSTLEALALGGLEEAGEGERILALLDARVDEVYGGIFRVQSGNLVPEGAEFCCSPGSIADHTPSAGRVWLIGTGAVRYRELGALQVVGKFITEESAHQTSASAVARLAERDMIAGKAQPPADLTAVYLREAVLAKKE